MAGFFKNRFRNRLLSQAWQERQRSAGNVKPVFPDVRKKLRWGFLYALEGAEDLGHLQELLDWLGREKFEFNILAIETGKCFKDAEQMSAFGQDAGADGRLYMVGRESINWIGVPQQEKVSDFLQQKADLLVVLCRHSDFTVEYLAARSASPFIMGMAAPHKGDYNMVLAPDEKEIAPAEYLQQLCGYLRNMNKESGE